MKDSNSAQRVLLLWSLVLQVVVLTLFSERASAHIDYGVTTLFRSYSPGLSLNPSIGYSQKIWGDPSSPWFGFVRPYVIGVVSPSVYEAKAGLEFFPVSILGFDLRRAYGRRFNDTKNQNCDVLECQGALPYTDVSVQSFLGHRNFFASLRFTRTFFDGDDSRSFPVYELGSAVLLNSGGDRGDYLSVAVGQSLGGFLNGLSWGILVQNNEFYELGQYMRALYGFAALDLADGQSASPRPLDSAVERVTVGIGAFRSSRNVAEFSIVVAYTYSPRSALGFGR